MAWDRQDKYPNTKYETKTGLPKGATIKSGGCGPTSVGNVLRNYVGISQDRLCAGYQLRRTL